MRGFRVAAEGPTWRHVALTLAQTAVFWTWFLFVLPELVHGFETTFPVGLSLGLSNPRLLGGTVFALGGALGLWSGILMAVRGRGTPLPLTAARVFVQSGPYHLIRNPMALAGISQAIGVGIWRNSPSVLMYALTGAVLWHTVVRVAEENDLEARFGEALRRHRERVPLWLPWLLPRLGESILGVLMIGVAVVLAVAAARSSLFDLARATPASVLAALLGVLLWCRSRRRVTARAVSPRRP